MMVKIGIALIVVLILAVWFTRAPKRSGLENGTRITLTASGTVLYATLNDTSAA